MHTVKCPHCQKEVPSDGAHACREKERPPRVWVTSHELDGGAKQFFHAYGSKEKAEDNRNAEVIACLSLTEHEHLISQAREEVRRKCYEEAAEYLYTTDSSDSQHDLVEELRNDFLAMAKAAPTQPTESSRVAQKGGEE